MRSAPNVPVLLVLCALAALGAGCDLFGSDDNMDQSLPPGPALVASMGGDVPGIWIFDPETLEPTPVIETQDGTPIGVVSSPDHERWYTAWRTVSPFENLLAALDPVDRRITERTSMPTQAYVQFSAALRAGERPCRCFRRRHHTVFRCRDAGAGARGDHRRQRK